MRQTIIHPVPGVLTEGGAADWVSILGGVNNINKILGIVPKREFSVVYQNAKNVVKMVVFLLLQNETKCQYRDGVWCLFSPEWQAQTIPGL